MISTVVAPTRCLGCVTAMSHSIEQLGKHRPCPHRHWPQGLQSKQEAWRFLGPALVASTGNTGSDTGSRASGWEERREQVGERAPPPGACQDTQGHAHQG